MEPGARLRRRPLRNVVIGALVDNLETHVFQHWNAFRKRDRPPVTPHFQPSTLLCLAINSIEVNTERMFGRQLLHHADIGDRLARRVGFTITVGERVAILREQRARFARLVRFGQHLGESIGPRAHDFADVGFQARLIGVRRCALVPSNDVMHARERPVREKLVARAHMAVEDLREIIPDLIAQSDIEIFAWHVNQDRDKTIETIAPRQHADARPFLQLQDGKREA